MSNIRILDCTLRDGGYCNNWIFGKENIQTIVNGLLESNINIIECGYINQKKEYDPDSTQHISFEQIGSYIPKDRGGKIFVGMINFGEFVVEDIPKNDGTSIDGIRVCFKKKDRIAALDYCKQIKDKGYKVFIQGMVSLSFTDEEFIDFIRRTNKIEPYAFYIVDSFGMMKGKDLIRLFYTVEHNLSPSIHIGFHSHNNMQLAYSNCLSLTQVQSNRSIIIDSSIYGMGRGAGNLNTELFTEYLNENHGSDYKLKPLLTIVDDILDGFYKKNNWGYSLPNYISAKNNAHPNYAGFLDDKKTLTVEDMENIFLLMDEDKKVSFDKMYIEELYTKYLATGRVQEEHKDELLEKLKGKKVVLVAPGRSSVDEREKIISQNAVLISVNFDYPSSDFVFLSNLRRYKELTEDSYAKSIVTSNVTSDRIYMQIKYSDLLNSVETVKDNAGLMAIKFLIGYGVEEIMLAGFDGYSHETKDNYADNHMEFVTGDVLLDAMNEGMEIMLKKYSKKIKISFLTTPKYVVI
jgi:4-hydroxy 2-oxovalerate aldolase